ncbi:hypothetical protein MACJ_002292 [Theileria orientalis]|uniref:Uncharacterized protein n=1 Tax=Theileria orientalis TaxID=68886 RepID=A0A976M8B8_THEOR|nr:hypothetical protein MACJ_002292 [Theileria orientalis]
MAVHLVYQDKLKLQWMPKGHPALHLDPSLVVELLMSLHQQNDFKQVTVVGNRVYESDINRQTRPYYHTVSYSSQASTPKTGVDLNIKSDKKTTKKFECEKRGNIVTYTPKGDNAFKLVKEDKTELWEATDARNYSDRIEVDLLNNDSKALTVYLGDKTKVFKKDGIHKLWKEIDTTKVHPASINIDYPHECYSYKNELKGRIRTFTAKTGFAFNCANEYVNNNKFEIWKTDQESEYANKIEVNLIDNDSTALTVYLAGNKTRVFKKDGKNEPWTEIDTTKVHPTSININYPDESYLYKNELRGNFRIFTAKTGFAFKGANEYVDDKKFEIWKTNFESEYVNKIEVDIINKDSRAVTIHLGENKTRVFMRSGMNEPWKEIDKSKPNPISVYINYPHESYSYKNELKDRIRTFTTKKGFAIKCANEYIDDENRNEIWRTDNENEYVNKIEVDLISYESRAVTIFMGDGKTRIFMRNGNNEPWKEIDKSKVNPKPINISYPFETYFYKNQLKGETRTITPKKAFAFKGVVEYVRNKKVEIWRADNDSEYSEKVVSEGNNKVTIYIGNDGTAKVFNKGSDGKWTEDCSGGIKATETDYETQPSSSAAESSSETGWSSETDREDGDVKAGGISPEFSISQNGGGKYPANKEVGSTEGLIDGAYGMRSDALHPEDDMMDGRYTMPTPGHVMVQVVVCHQVDHTAVIPVVVLWHPLDHFIMTFVQMLVVVPKEVDHTAVIKVLMLWKVGHIIMVGVVTVYQLKKVRYLVVVRKEVDYTVVAINTMKLMNIWNQVNCMMILMTMVPVVMVCPQV